MWQRFTQKLQTLSWRYVALAVVLVLVLAVTAAATYSVVLFRQVTVKPNQDPNAQVTPSPTPDLNQPFSVLLMGYGGGGHAGGKLTDTMMVAHVVPKQERIYLISLPRDLWVPIESREGQLTNMKINAAYAIGSDDKNYRYKPVQYTGEAGGGEMAKDAVELVLGIPIQHFAVLSFRGFQKSIDVLGGVTVMVEKTFDDYLYPIEGKENDTCEKTPEELAAIATLSAALAEKEFPCRYEHLHFDKGLTLMTGETALKYVRSRHSAQDGNDFGRAARQRALIVAVKKRVLDLNFAPKIVPFISSIAADFRTDIDLETMQKWLARQDEFSEYEISSVALTNENILTYGRSSDGQFIVMPKAGEGEWSSVHQWLQEQLQPAPPASQSASASASVLPSARPIPAVQNTNLE